MRDTAATAAGDGLPNEAVRSGAVNETPPGCRSIAAAEQGHQNTINGGHQGPPPPPPGQSTGVLGGSRTSTQQSTLSALSEMLGTDTDSLLGQLQSGTDLTDLLSAKGVTLDQLSSKLEEGLLIDTRA